MKATTSTTCQRNAVVRNATGERHTDTERATPPVVLLQPPVQAVGLAVGRLACVQSAWGGVGWGGVGLSGLFWLFAVRT